MKAVMELTEEQRGNFNWTLFFNHSSVLCHADYLQIIPKTTGNERAPETRYIIGPCAGGTDEYF